MSRFYERVEFVGDLFKRRALVWVVVPGALRWEDWGGKVAGKSAIRRRN